MANQSKQNRLIYVKLFVGNTSPKRMKHSLGFSLINSSVIKDFPTNVEKKIFFILFDSLDLNFRFLCEQN